MHFRVIFLIGLMYILLPLNNYAQEQHRRIFLEEFPSVSASQFILYYTPIKENIFHPKSVFYVDTSEQKSMPFQSIDELPSISAILVNEERQMLARITFQQNKQSKLIIIEEYQTGRTYTDTLKSNKVPYPRAEELKLLELPHYETVQDRKELQEELSLINQQYKLYDLKPSNLYIPTQNEINDAFLYFSYEFSQEYQNNLEFWKNNSYEWGRKGYDFGVNEIHILFMIFEYLNPNLLLDEDLKNCIKQGYDGL